MNNLILTATALWLAVAALPGVARGEDDPRFLVSMNANYAAFTSADVDSDGSQGIGYLQLGYGVEQWGVNVAASAATTDYRTLNGAERFSLTSLNDTDLATFYSVEISGVTVRGGVDLRAPTGTASLPGAQLASMMADDLATDLLLLNSFGRGWEATPHLMAVGALSERFTAGVGMRYSFKGEYDPTRDQAGDRLDPGDQALAVVNAIGALAEDDYVIASVTYSLSGRDKLEGADIFRAGDVWTVDLRGLWTVTPLLRLTVGALYQTQGKNERMGEEGVFTAEQANANHNAAELYVSGSWVVRDRLTLTGLVGYRAVGSNAYAAADPYYDAGREKLYVAPGVQYSFGDDAYVTATLRYSRIVDKADGYSPTDAVYQVGALDLALTRLF